MALVVLSLGGLVAGALQGTSQRANHDAQQRLIATFLANEIIEKMRTNPAGLDSYNRSSLNGSGVGQEPSPTCTAGSKCKPEQLARHDLWQWERSIVGATVKIADEDVGGLVNPVGCIDVANGQVTVVLSWTGIDVLSDSAKEAGGDASCGQSGPDRRQLVMNTFIR